MPAFWRVWNHLGRYRPYSDTRQFQVHPVHLDGRNRERGPSTKEDIRLSDIVASKPTAARSGIIQYDFGKKCAKDQLSVTGTLNKPSMLLLISAGKVETNAILGGREIPHYISKIVQRDPFIFALPGLEQDILIDPHFGYATESVDNTCDHSDLDRIRHRLPRETQNPKVHYGLVASGNQVMRHGATRDMMAREYGILCFEMVDIAQCLVPRVRMSIFRAHFFGAPFFERTARSSLTDGPAVTS